jgi:hypothetical protein
LWIARLWQNFRYTDKPAAVMSIRICLINRTVLNDRALGFPEARPQKKKLDGRKASIAGTGVKPRTGVFNAS